MVEFQENALVHYWAWHHLVSIELLPFCTILCCCFFFVPVHLTVILLIAETSEFFVYCFVACAFFLIVIYPDK